jgi:hypothetical protein
MYTERHIRTMSSEEIEPGAAGSVGLPNPTEVSLASGAEVRFVPPQNKKI